MPSAVKVAANVVGVGALPYTPQDTADDLALGLELKFLVLGLPLNESNIRRGRMLEAETASTDISQRQAYAAIACAIEHSRMQQDGSLGNISLLFTRAISRYDIVDSGRQERDFWRTHWIIKKANSVEHRKEDPRPDARLTNGVIVPVEMSSPTLDWTDPYTPTRVRDVVLRVNKSFAAITNCTCDVHIHVGRIDGMAFNLQTLKKLATIFWLAEPILRSVRNPRSPNFANVYTWGFEQRRYSRLARALDKLPVASDGVRTGEDMLLRVRSGTGSRENEEDWKQCMGGIGRPVHRNEAVRAIWRTVSPVELGLLLSGTQREYRRLGFNFSAFGEEDERARTNPRTVEFRFLEGTLKDELILGWMHICGKLVELGMKDSQTRFRDVVRYLLSQQPVYEDFRNADKRNCGDDRSIERVFERHSSYRAALFGELMERIGADAAAYGPFQAKIRQEYAST